MRFCLAAFLLACTLAAAAPPAARVSPDPARAGLDAAALTHVKARLNEAVQENLIPGAVVLIGRKGSVALLETVGYQDLEKKTPMRPDTIFQIMSMTKPVTAVGIMMLAEEGRLAISDPVEKHLPEFRGQWLMVAEKDGERILKKPSRVITIRDLLTHTSGLPQTGPEATRDLYQKLEMSLAEVTLLNSQLPLLFEPGTKWQYSNPGIAALGRIIEVVSGQPYEEFLAKRIFEPLGMTDTFFFPDRRPDAHSRIARVYAREEGKLQDTEKTRGANPLRPKAKYPMPEGGLYSTAADMFSFYEMVRRGGELNGKRLLSPATVEMMTANHTPGIQAGHAPGMAYGLAWALTHDPLSTLTLQSKGAYGHGGAFGTLGWVDPDKELVGVFMVQQPRDIASLRNGIVTIANAAVRE